MPPPRGVLACLFHIADYTLFRAGGNKRWPTGHHDWETTMFDYFDAPLMPLPKHWTRRVRSAVLHVISLARMAGAEVRGWAVNSPIARLRLAA